MWKYVLKRVLIFLPTLLIISLITFIISINAPGDPVEMMLTSSNQGLGQSTQKIATEKAYLDLKKQLGLDLPVFYFSLSSAAIPDSLYKIPKLQHKLALERLCKAYGNWNEISAFYLAARELDLHIYDVAKDSLNAGPVRFVKDRTAELLMSYEPEQIQLFLSELDSVYQGTPSFGQISTYFGQLKNTHREMEAKANPWSKFIPVVHFYGIKNQYHNWFFGDKTWLSSLPFVDDSKAIYRTKGFLRGDFGISYQDKRPVSSVLWDAVRWTMLISFLSILISYSVAIPLGIKSAVKKGTRTDRSITTFLFMLYSLPNFWVATMAIMFLCGGDYFDWFPAFGLGTLPESAPFFERFGETAYHLILPLACWTYSSFAYLSRQMRGGMLNVIGQDYIRTARAKGLGESKIIWKHAFRNSLLPVITLFANIFPLVISGSFIIEFIFSIPGMGKISLDALVARNYPIVFTVMMFSAILTMVGMLVADILYSTVDPRITFTRKR